MNNTYIVKKGNSPWQIANDSGISLDEFYRLNPTVKEKGIIHPGDIVKISPDIIKEEVDIRLERQKENIANKNNITAIQQVKHDSNYVIVDKKNKLLTVFDKNNNPIYSTSDISTGLSGDDYNTITYTNNGKLVNNAGNNSTPAGITVIKNVGLYHGSPSFIRQRYNKDGSLEDVASSIHLGNTNKRLASNGCIRASDKALQELSTYVGSGTKVYTLPEKEGSKFTVRGGKLNFVADNPNGETTGDRKYWDDYNTYVDKTYSPLKLKWEVTGNKEYDNNRRQYATSLASNKKRLQDEFGLTSDEYDRLAELALGIAEQESKFGTSKRYDLKQGIGKPIVQLLRGNSRSRGLTQIKIGNDNKELQKFYAKEFVYSDIENPRVAAIATIGRLANMYVNEVKGRHFKGENNIDITPEQALLYKWNGHNDWLKSGTANPNENTYIGNVNKYSKNFQMFSVRQRKQYSNGGVIKRRLESNGQYS